MIWNLKHDLVDSFPSVKYFKAKLLQEAETLANINEVKQFLFPYFISKYEEAHFYLPSHTKHREGKF